MRCLKALLRAKLVHHDNSKYDGYRLTNLGYDFLALNALVKRGAIAAVGRQIGVGKESDVFEVCPACSGKSAYNCKAFCLLNRKAGLSSCANKPYTPCCLHVGSTRSDSLSESITSACGLLLPIRDCHQPAGCSQWLKIIKASLLLCYVLHSLLLYCKLRLLLS